MTQLSKPKIKICGIKNIATLDCCINENVNYFGMIFYNKSPRNISFEESKNLINYSQNKIWMIKKI